MTESKRQESVPEIVDLDELFRDWAKDFFETTERRDLEKKLGLKLHWEDLRVTLDYTHFYMDTEHYDHKRLQPLKNSNHVVFKTTYSNTTSSKLEYNLSTERTTRNVITLKLSKGLTHSGSVGLKLKLPLDVGELEGSYSRELTMQKEREVSREEEMVWSANTTVSVPAKTDTTMELVVEEQEYDGSFECAVRISGKVVVLIHKGESEICRLVAKKLDGILTSRLGFAYDTSTKSVTYKISGSCMCRRGLQQSIRLSERPTS